MDGTEIRFEAGPGPDRGADLRSLHKWLSDDMSLRGHARIGKVAEGAGREAAASPGLMGIDAEAVAAVVSTAVALAQLPLSFDAWRQARRPRSPITVHVVGADAERIAEIMRAYGQTPPEPAVDPEPAARPPAPGERGPESSQPEPSGPAPVPVRPAAGAAQGPTASATDPAAPSGVPPRPEGHAP
ncbi:effector-associated constant component EACC1 [Streptomyces sp. NPDC054887]